MEINFDKVKAFSAVTFLQLICGVIVPGFLFLFIFKRDLFLSLDIFRLTVLAISITAPLLIVNSIIVLYGVTKDEVEGPDEDGFHRVFAATTYLGSALTIPVVYAAITIGYFFSFTLKQGVFILVIAEAIILITLFLFIFAGSKNTKSIK